MEQTETTDRKRVARKEIEKIRTMVDIGQLVEITIRAGAEHDNGYTPAPTTNPHGYYGCDDERMTDKPGNKVVGYVGEYKDESLLLAQELNNEKRKVEFRNGHVFVYGTAIHSFRKL